MSVTFRNRQLNRTLVNNFLWFLASLGLAVFVWVLASTQADPVDIRRFTGIPIQYNLADNLVLVDSPRTSVRVNIRAQQSTLDLLQADDIVVSADLREFGPGTYTVELDTNIARRAVADTQPAQVTVTLETVESKLVEITTMVSDLPPLGFSRGETTLEVTQIRVTGAASLVEEVTQAQVDIDLSEQRVNYLQDLTINVLDADGNPVSGLTVEPQTVEVSIPVTQRDDVDIVGVEPDIDTETLESGYEITSFSFEPQNIIVSGNLTTLPDTLLTERISLTGRTNDFSDTVAVQLPENILVLSERNVTVSIGISPIIMTRTLENVALTVIGLEPSLSPDLLVSEVDVIVTGPQAQIEELSATDVRAVIDLNGLTAGTYSLNPTATISQAETQIIPSTISVTLRNSVEITETAEPPGP